MLVACNQGNRSMWPNSQWYWLPVQVRLTGLLQFLPWLLPIPGYLSSQFQDEDLVVSRGSERMDSEHLLLIAK